MLKPLETACCVSNKDYGGIGVIIINIILVKAMGVCRSHHRPLRSKQCY